MGGDEDFEISVLVPPSFPQNDKEEKMMKRLTSVISIAVLVMSVIAMIAPLGFAGTNSKATWLSLLPYDNRFWGPNGLAWDNTTSGTMVLYDGTNSLLTITDTGTEATLALGSYWLFNQSQVHSTMMAVSSVNIANISIDTGTLAGGSTTWLLSETAGIYWSAFSSAPRTMVLSITNLDTKIGTNTINCTAVVSGINARGRSDSETITFSTVTPLYEVGRTSYVGVGHIAWLLPSSITVTLDGASAQVGCADDGAFSNFWIGIGLGSGIGLRNNITTSSRVQKVSVNGERTTDYGTDVNEDVVYVSTTTGVKGPFGTIFEVGFDGP